MRQKGDKAKDRAWAEFYQTRAELRANATFLEGLAREKCLATIKKIDAKSSTDSPPKSVEGA